MCRSELPCQLRVCSEHGNFTVVYRNSFFFRNRIFFSMFQTGLTLDGSHGSVVKSLQVKATAGFPVASLDQLHVRLVLNNDGLFRVCTVG